MAHKIGIIFPVINKWELTTVAVGSVKSKYEMFVVLVDNGSSDSTLTWAKQGGSNIIDKVIENGTNKGLTIAWNQGVLAAREAGCDLVILANNDIVLHPETINNMVDELDQHADWGMITAVNDKGWCDANGGPDAILTKIINEPGNVSPHPDFSFFMVRMSAFDTLKAKEEPEGKEPNPGMFDEQFSHRGKAYFEDNDFHYRMHKAGIPCMSTTRAPYYHYASQTANQGNVIGLNFDLNRMYFIEKHGMSPQQTGL